MRFPHLGGLPFEFSWAGAPLPEPQPCRRERRGRGGSVLRLLRNGWSAVKSTLAGSWRDPSSPPEPARRCSKASRRSWPRAATTGTTGYVGDQLVRRWQELRGPEANRRWGPLFRFCRPPQAPQNGGRMQMERLTAKVSWCRRGHRGSGRRRQLAQDQPGAERHRAPSGKHHHEEV